MKVQNLTRLTIGIMVTLGVGLGYYVHEYWYFLTVFFGLALIQSSFTNFCGVDKLWEAFGFEK